MLGRCLLLLVRTCSAHHASRCSPPVRWVRAGLTSTLSNFPTMTKSSLMNLYLNREHPKSSISQTINYYYYYYNYYYYYYYYYYYHYYYLFIYLFSALHCNPLRIRCNYVPKLQNRPKFALLVGLL